jgi:ribosomal protein S18 acetylase RimI-like enzyme
MPGQEPAVTVRHATEADVPALKVIAHEAYLHYVARIGRMPAPMTADYAAAVRSGQAWVAEADGEVAGLLVLVVCQGYLLIENVAVLPSAQRRGIGARLLALAEDEARAHGLGEIRLYTNEAMTENLAYYPSHGYVQTHRAEQDGFRRVFFSKRL